MNSLAHFSHVVFSFAATYVLHSTVLLATCWLVIRGARVTSHFLTERMWKLATVLGLVTAVLQIGTGVRPIIEFAQTASTDTLNDSALIELPEQTSSVSTTGSRHSVGSSERLTGSIENGDGVESANAYAPTQQFGRTEDEVTAGALIRTTAPSAAPGEPKRADQNGRLRGSQSPSESALVAGAFNRIIDLPANIVQMVSIALTMAFVVGALLLLWKSLWLRRKCLGACVLRDGPARLTLDCFLKRNRIRRRIRLLASSRYTEPFTYGLIGWTIVLPDCTDKRLGPDELKALLAHEVAHLVRGDAYWLWIGQLLCTCLAFQPLNFIARRRWQQSAEYLCDDWAVERGIRSLSLARCLTQIAEWRIGSQPCSIGLAAGGTRATLVQRIERLIEEQQPTDGWAKPVRRRIANVATVFCSVMLIGFAPRVAVLHLTESTAHASSEIQENSDNDLSRLPQFEQDWEALHQDLLELETDLGRATHLLERSKRYSGMEPLMSNIRRNAMSLCARSKRISLSLGKESE